MSFLQECFMSFRAEAIERGVTLDFRVPTAPLSPPADSDGHSAAAGTYSSSRLVRRLSTTLPFRRPSNFVAGAVVPTAAADRRKSSVQQAAAYLATLAEVVDEDADRAALMVPLTASDTVHMDKFKANQGNACTSRRVSSALPIHTHSHTHNTRALSPAPAPVVVRNLVSNALKVRTACRLAFAVVASLLFSWWLCV